MALCLEVAPPVMGAAAGFHHYRQRRPILHGPGKCPPAQSLALQDVPCRVGEGQLKNLFCQIDCDGRSMHGLDSSRAPVTETRKAQCGPRGRVATREESISAFNPTLLRYGDPGGR